MNIFRIIILGLTLLSLKAFCYQNLEETGYFNMLEMENSQHDFPEERFSGEIEKEGSESGFQSKTIRSRAGSWALFSRYSPQYPLWSDGSRKRRWVYIPKRSLVDTSDPDAWVFPVGTKLWKEFSFREGNGFRKIETRILEKTAPDSWLMETYAWNDEQTEAIVAPKEGIKNAYALGDGKFYDIPGKHECEYCHSKAGIKAGPIKTPVLGFSALQLSDNRDPNAIHSEPLTAGMLTLSKLQMRGKTSTIMKTMPAIPESENAPLQRRVLGYLHGNCSHCHNDSGLGEFTNTTNFFHSAKASFIQQNGTYKTALGKPITQYLNPLGSPELIINPGNASRSALIYRMTEEDEQYTFKVPPWHHNAGFSLTVGAKMPFVGTNLIDQEAVDIISKYINQLPPSF